MSSLKEGFAVVTANWMGALVVLGAPSDDAWLVLIAGNVTSVNY